eukprot:SAG31_NODE_46439_length_254_cov_1.000000_1_plen_37_part_10
MLKKKALNGELLRPGQLALTRDSCVVGFNSSYARFVC